MLKTEKATMSSNDIPKDQEQALSEDELDKIAGGSAGKSTGSSGGMGLSSTMSSFSGIGSSAGVGGAIASSSFGSSAAVHDANAAQSVASVNQTSTAKGNMDDFVQEAIDRQNSTLEQFTNMLPNIKP